MEDERRENAIDTVRGHLANLRLVWVEDLDALEADITRLVGNYEIDLNEVEEGLTGKEVALLLKMAAINEIKYRHETEGRTASGKARIRELLFRYSITANDLLDL